MMTRYALFAIPLFMTIFGPFPAVETAGERLGRQAASCGCQCVQQYIPVCGIDGREETTFSNRCELQCCQKNRPNLREKFEGVCAEKYVPGQGSGKSSGSTWGQPSRPAVQPPRGSGWGQTDRPAIQPPRGSSYPFRPVTQPPRWSQTTQRQSSNWIQTTPRGSSWSQTASGGSGWVQPSPPATQPPRGQWSQGSTTERPWWQSTGQTSGNTWRQSRGLDFDAENSYDYR
ncbi:hypothetical protein Ocin01_07706, partial [Orchesella cincta]